MENNGENDVQVMNGGSTKSLRNLSKRDAKNLTFKSIIMYFVKIFNRLGMGGEFIGGQRYMDEINEQIFNQTSGAFTGTHLMIAAEAGNW